MEGAVESLSLALLDDADVEKTKKQGYTAQQLHDLAKLVESRLLEFGVEATVVGVHPGPVITRFEIDLAASRKAGVPFIRLIRMGEMQM